MESFLRRMDVWGALHAVAHVGYGGVGGNYGGVGGKIALLKPGNHVSLPRCVYSDADSDADLISYADSDAQLNFNAGHDYRF